MAQHFFCLLVSFSKTSLLHKNTVTYFMSSTPQKWKRFDEKIIFYRPQSIEIGLLILRKQCNSFKKDFYKFTPSFKEPLWIQKKISSSIKLFALQDMTWYFVPKGPTKPNHSVMVLCSCNCPWSRMVAWHRLGRIATPFFRESSIQTNIHITLHYYYYKQKSFWSPLFKQKK